MLVKVSIIYGNDISISNIGILMPFERVVYCIINKFLSAAKKPKQIRTPVSKNADIYTIFSAKAHSSVSHNRRGICAGFSSHHRIYGHGGPDGSGHRCGGARNASAPSHQCSPHQRWLYLCACR